MMKLALTSALLLAWSAGAAAGQQPSGHADKPHAIVAVPNSIEWSPAPAALPPGAQLAVLEGDPSKPGAFTMRLSMPAGYRIPPHFHPVTEHVTVITGTFYVGMGDAFDASKASELPAGTFAALEPGVRHFAFTRDVAVIQLHGVGPWGLTYVNPADDPRNRASR